MLPIDHNICSFNSCTREPGRLGASVLTQEMAYVAVNDVRLSEGYIVTSFHQLVSLTGFISLRNRRYDLYFRGQAKDYKDSNGRTIIYPSVCRPEQRPPGAAARIHPALIEKRFAELQEFASFLKKQQYRQRYDEYYYALAQHYELLPTPLIDVTQSLRVAATFALRSETIGYLFVLGLPYLQGSISHFVDQNMTLVKLLHVCPANALRPRYQEGFLVGRLPFTPGKESGDNIANRLLAKFKLDNGDGKFWDKYFEPLPDELLFPDKDIYLQWLKKSFKAFQEEK